MSQQLKDIIALHFTALWCCDRHNGSTFDLSRFFHGKLCIADDFYDNGPKSNSKPTNLKCKRNQMRSLDDGRNSSIALVTGVNMLTKKTHSFLTPGSLMMTTLNSSVKHTQPNSSPYKILLTFSERQKTGQVTMGSRYSRSSHNSNKISSFKPLQVSYMQLADPS